VNHPRMGLIKMPLKPVPQPELEMKPIIHAENSVKKYGGKVEDYMRIHEWFDDTKAHIADHRHRALKHHTQGIFEAEKVFGSTFVNSDGKTVSGFRIYPNGPRLS
jgi:hypothetical protein